MSTDNSPAEAERAERERIISILVAGERLAMECLFREFQQALLDYVDPQLESAIRPRVDADDVVQEVLLTAHRRLPRFLQLGAPLPILGWLKCIANQELVNTYRRHKFAKRRSINLEVRQPRTGSVGQGPMNLDQFPGNILTASWIQILKERREVVHWLMDRVGEPLRLVMQLRYLEERSAAEIAEIVSMTPGEVEGICSGCRRFLKRKFQDMGICITDFK